jgi:hypothetical protein
MCLPLRQCDRAFRGFFKPASRLPPAHRAPQPDPDIFRRRFPAVRTDRWYNLALVNQVVLRAVDKQHREALLARISWKGNAARTHRLPLAIACWPAVRMCSSGCARQDAGAMWARFSATGLVAHSDRTALPHFNHDEEAAAGPADRGLRMGPRTGLCRSRGKPHHPCPIGVAAQASRTYELQQ